MSFDSLCIHICDIETLAQGAQDDYGQPAETFSDSYTDKECRLMPMKGIEIKIGAQVFISNYTLYLPANTEVDWQDRVSNIRLRSNDSVIDSGTYEILEVQIQSDGISEHHREVLLRKVD